MAFQGNLRDFSVTEVLQLLGTQRKTGCLMLEWSPARALFWVLDGKLVSTRQSGMLPEDPLLRFLLEAHRLSSEQYRGIETIQRESNRDLEDLLVNGRYVEAEELGVWIERQILDDLMKVTTWQNGSYRFDPLMRWPNPPLVKLGIEAALMEVARRVDEQHRFAGLRSDPHQIIGVRDLPAAGQEVAEEESELFGIIDGQRTLGEIVAAAPLSEYEAFEALQRMLDEKWIEVTGRRDTPAPEVETAAEAAEHAGAPARTVPLRPSLGRELTVAAGIAALAVTLAIAGRAIGRPAPTAGTADVFRTAAMRDVRMALELYRRERGQYPATLDELVQDRWVTKDQTRAGKQPLRYRVDGLRSAYLLEADGS
jgi:hypothetical protein